MVTMIDRNGVEVKNFLVNIYDADGQFAYGFDLGVVESKFPCIVSNYETATAKAKEIIADTLGSEWVDDYECISK